MEIKSVVEQEILRCFREITGNSKKKFEIQIDEDLTVTGEKCFKGVDKIDNIVIIKIYGCAINE